jgi:hypothetical protein
MSRIESIQALSKTISDTLTVSRKSFQKLPTPLANQLMPQVERDDGNIEAKFRRMDDSARNAVAGDTVNNVSNMAREAKNVLPLLIDRTKATDDVGKTLMKLARQMSPLDQIRIKEAVRDTTQFNKQTIAQTNQFKKDADALAREASPYTQITPNGIQILNINSNQKTCELVFAGVAGAKVKLKLTHVLNSGGHCNPKNLDVGGTCLVAYQGNTEQSFHP